MVGEMNEYRSKMFSYLDKSPEMRAKLELELEKEQISAMKIQSEEVWQRFENLEKEIELTSWNTNLDQRLAKIEQTTLNRDDMISWTIAMCKALT